MTPILVREVRVRNLRCHAAMRWNCEAGINLLTGENGSGKTTLLEAVCMMAWGRSFRQARDPYLVRRGADGYAVAGQWQRFGPMTLEIAGRRGRVTMRLQGREVVRRAETAMAFPVVVEAPQGMRLVDGLPGERRRWLNALMALKRPAATELYRRYLRAIMQRGRLLRRGVGDAQLEAWEAQIVETGLALAALRDGLVDEINGILERECLPEAPLRLRMTGGEYRREEWLERLQNRRQDDLRSGLRYGPHADRIVIESDGREIRQAGSRGQQKLAAVALRMAECELWSRYRGLMPVVLLDDAWEALDRARQQRLMARLLEHPGQVLMTSPGVPRAAGDGLRVHCLDELRRSAKDGLSKMEEAA